MANFSVNLGGDYVTFAKIPSGEDSVPITTQTKDGTEHSKPSPPKRPASAGLRRFMDRRREFMKLVCSLPDEKYLFLTLLADKARNPDAISNPKIWQKWLNRLRTAFLYHYPKGFFIWRVEMDTDNLGIHFHIIVNTGEDTIPDDFKIWACKIWGRIINSTWERIVDVQEMTPAHIGYFFKNEKKSHSHELECLLGKSFSFGMIGKKNCNFKPVKNYQVDSEIIEIIREVLTKQTILQRKFRPGKRINTAHIFRIKSDYCFHAFLGELRPKIQDILEDAGHEPRHATVRPWAEMDPGPSCRAV